MHVALNGTARLVGQIFPRNFSAPSSQFFMHLGVRHNILIRSMLNLLTSIHFHDPLNEHPPTNNRRVYANQQPGDSVQGNAVWG